MTTSKINLRFGVLTGMILLAAFSRVIPHPFGFSPLGAIGLFGAAYFAKKWQAILIPIVAAWLSDLFLDNVIYAHYYPEFNWYHQGLYTPYAGLLLYSSYLLSALVGMYIFKTVTPQRVLIGALASTVIFFLVSNFSGWIGDPLYSQDLKGLITCYIAGIPFIKGTLLGDICYSVVLFGTFAWAQKQIPSLKLKSA